MNRELELVGVVFDGNIESLPGDYIYVPDRNRAIGVDARGMLEALDEIYDADRLVLELTTGRSFPFIRCRERLETSRQMDQPTRIIRPFDTA